MKKIITFLFLSIFFLQSCKSNIENKENTWVFLLAGQSNMAGRATVEKEDTLTHPRVLSIDSTNKIIKAKEPLHFYEPKLAGLGNGLAFGKYLINHIPDSINILLIPTAVGGSSINMWIEDSLFRNVSLLSNFDKKVQFAQKHGIIKGILWHQGEEDADSWESIQVYEENLNILFSHFRKQIGNDTIPILIGELASFSKNPENWQAINEQIYSYASKDKNAHIITTQDLKDLGDKTHFDAQSQREIGKRFAAKYLEIMH